MVKQEELEELKKMVVRYFCDRPNNFPVGRPFNCCESVLLTLKNYLDVDPKLLSKIGTVIGAGVTLNGLLCGSVSSVMIAIGIKYGRTNPEENPQPVWSMADKYVSEFKKKFGAVNCRQLTGLNLKTGEGLKEYFARVHDYECTERLKFAVEKAITLLEE